MICAEAVKDTSTTELQRQHCALVWDLDKDKLTHNFPTSPMPVLFLKFIMISNTQTMLCSTVSTTCHLLVHRAQPYLFKKRKTTIFLKCQPKSLPISTALLCICAVLTSRLRCITLPDYILHTQLYLEVFQPWQYFHISTVNRCQVLRFIVKTSLNKYKLIADKADQLTQSISPSVPHHLV